MCVGVERGGSRSGAAQLSGVGCTSAHSRQMGWCHASVETAVSVMFGVRILGRLVIVWSGVRTERCLIAT